MMKLEGAMFPWRFRVVVGLLGIMVAAISWRIIDLQVVDRAFLKGQGDARSVRHIPICLLYTSPSPRDRQKSRMPSSA